MRQASKLLVIWLALLTAMGAQNTIAGTGKISGNLQCLPGAPSGQPIFSLAGGTYSGSQSLTISGCGSKQILYRTDGGPVTIASKMYSSPLTISSTETVSAICATVGAYQTNVQADVASAFCHTINAVGTGNGSPCDTTGGGIGSLPFASAVYNVASTATVVATTLATASSSTQGLFGHFFSSNANPVPGRCDTCTTQVEDFVLTASAGSGTFENIETDMPQYLGTVYAPVTTGIDRQNGVQCNQHSNHDWEVDSGNAGGWQDTGFPCAYTAGKAKEVVVRVSHANGDIGCGGQGCANYTDLWDIDSGTAGNHYTLGGSYGGTQGYDSQTGGHGWGTQKQPDFQTTSGTALTGTLTVTAETVAMGYGDESAATTANYVITPNVATPTFSVASGAVAPGTQIIPSTTTPGAVVAYTIDGTTPGCQSYTAGSASPILGTGTSMIFRSTITANSTTVSVPPPVIYGPRTIKAIGCKNGVTPSPVATAAYTLTAPAGTGISAATLTLTGTKYLTADVSCVGTCFAITAANTVLNLNGHTVTYGTSSGVQSSGTGLSTTSGSTTGTCPTCAFTAAINGLKIYADNYNTGGYQNTANTTVTYVSPTQVTFSSAPAFTTSNAEWFVASPPVYAFACDPKNYGTCSGFQVYNGTITQGNVLDAPGSNVFSVNPFAYGGANGPFVIADLTANYSAPEALFLHENDSSGADVITNDVLNISVTQIYYRDGLQYPIKFDNGGASPTTPIKFVYNNQILNSPQGGVQCSWACYTWNNYMNNTTTVQYANGYGIFGGNGATGEGASGSSFVGNTVLGASRGGEIEESNITMQYNQINVQDSATVHDPNHNPVGCEIDGGYGMRTKDFSSGLNNITSSFVDSNLLTVSTGPCGGQVLRYTAIGASDSGISSNNNYNLIANTSNGPSSFDSIDGAVMSGFTYSNQTYTASGSFVSGLYNDYIWFDQGTLWTVPNQVSPKMLWRQGNSGVNSSATLTGTGTASCTLQPNPGSTSSMALTFNGAAVTCH